MIIIIVIATLKWCSNGNDNDGDNYVTDWVDGAMGECGNGVGGG